MESPYDVLRVDPDADEAELVRAYRERVLETHPDQGGSEAEFRAVQEAYERIQAGEASADGPDGGWGADGPPGSDRSGPPGRGPGGPPGGDGGRARRYAEGRADRRAGGGPGRAGSTPTTARVEYLNYEVLDDFGWAIDDADLFEKAAGADLDATDHGKFAVEAGESLLEAAENRGFAWPFACRGGACANCAVAVVEGELSQPVDTILSDDLFEQGIRLSCNGEPLTDELRVVYNLKHRPDLDDLRLPPTRFERAYPTD